MSNLERIAAHRYFTAVQRRLTIIESKILHICSMNRNNNQTISQYSWHKGTLNITQEQSFMLSVLVVNAGNYAYNLILGRLLGPERYADAALLITLLLVLSFVAMTLQLTVAKFRAESTETQVRQIVSYFKQRAVILGSVIGGVLVMMSWWMADLLNVSSPSMFQVFGLCVPLYFVMSVHRGVHQGGSQFVKLSWSYQLEMWTKLVTTLILLTLLPQAVGFCIALGIVLSVTVGIWPSAGRHSFFKTATLPSQLEQTILRFAVFTCCYELSQILINNSDILLVKHYFDAEQAGLYSALAMIGRVVYFLAWMFVMLLLPKVIRLEKSGEDSRPLLMKYVSYTALMSGAIVGVSYLIPEVVILSLFGSAYLEIADLLWLYALATSAFAIANIYVYYALSLSRYIPIFITVTLGVVQVALVVMYHESLYQVVLQQVLAMGALLLIQVLYYRYAYTNQSR